MLTADLDAADRPRSASAIVNTTARDPRSSHIITVRASLSHLPMTCATSRLQHHYVPQVESLGSLCCVPESHAFTKHQYHGVPVCRLWI